MNTKKNILYYDSDCPICSAELAKLAKVKNDSLELVSIKDAELSEADKQALYDSLHVKTINGTFLRGYEANVFAWQQTKFHRWVKFLGLPPFSWLGKIGYVIWLKYYQFKRSQRNREKS